MSPSEHTTEIRLAFETVDQLRELFDNQLRYRRLFVTGVFTFAERARCTVVLEYPRDERFALDAEAVYVKSDEPGAGAGFELVGLDASKLIELERFVGQAVAKVAKENPNSRNLYERIRQLGLRERETTARQGGLTERVALERCYGSSVWEALLQNPQLSVPEVAHIAKNGTLSIPLVSVIVANHAWLANAEVRRALLSNPRATGAHLDRVLKAMPRTELKQLVQASPYRTQVKAAAKKLLGE